MLSKRELQRAIKAHNDYCKTIDKLEEKHKLKMKFHEKRGSANSYTAYLHPLWKIVSAKDRSELQKNVNVDIRSAMIFGFEEAKYHTARKLLRGLKRLGLDKDLNFISKLLGLSLADTKRWLKGIKELNYKEWWIRQYKKGSKV